MFDWINIIEAAYGLEGSQTHWLQRLVAAAAPVLDYGNGVTAQIIRNAPSDFFVESIRISGKPTTAEIVHRSISTAPPESIDRAYRSGITAATLSEAVFARVPGSAEAFLRATGGRYQDTLGIVAYTGIGKVVALNTPLPTARKMNRLERARWTKVAAHVGAGLRLRHVVGSLSADTEPEAVLGADARVVDPGRLAGNAIALNHLRHAVVLQEEARGGLRHRDADRALSIWEGLVRGRWSLIDKFDRDGRRFIVAVRNDPHVGDLRGLTARELQVAELIGIGRAAKEIGYLLGISPSAVNNAVGRVRRKLGLLSRSEMAAFFAPDGLRARLNTVDLPDAQLASGSYGAVNPAALELLTLAEQDVALLLLQGATNRAIALARKTSEYTVANQIKAIYAKLGVNDRAALATRLARRG